MHCLERNQYVVLDYVDEPNFSDFVCSDAIDTRLEENDDRIKFTLILSKIFHLWSGMPLKTFQSVPRPVVRSS